MAKVQMLVKVDPAKKVLYESAAKGAGTTLSDWVRGLMDREVNDTAGALLEKVVAKPAKVVRASKPVTEVKEVGGSGRRYTGEVGFRLGNRVYEYENDAGQKRWTPEAPSTEVLK